MTNQGRYIYTLQREVKNFDDLEELTLSESKKNEDAADFLPDWLNFKDSFKEFYEVVENEILNGIATPSENYAVTAWNKEYDFSGDAMGIHIGRDFSLNNLANEYKISAEITLNTARVPLNFPLLAQIKSKNPKYELLNRDLWEKDFPSLMEGKIKLIGNSPESKSHLRNEAEKFRGMAEYSDRLKISENVLLELYKKKESFTEEGLEKMIVDSGGEPKLFGRSVKGYLDHLKSGEHGVQIKYNPESKVYSFVK